MGVRLAAALWGLAEATFFFIVPDVLLTDLAIRRPRQLPVACLAALAGALVGGAAMHTWAASHPEAAVSAVDRVPAISRRTFDVATKDLRGEFPWNLAAMTFGAVRGVPYKAYAVRAARGGIGLPAFLALSVPARLTRFALTSALAWAVSAFLLKGLSASRKRLLFACAWAVFYAFFFLLMPN